ncbi:TetR/AcrR family transcriptional regulator [Rhodococcus erythropolis]
MTGANERRAADWLAGGNRSELATERIFAAAAELIREQGFDRFNADDVAARAGCSRATLYRYVGGKSAIHEGLLSRGAASVASQVATAVESLHGDERIVESILVAVDAIRSDAAMSHGLAAARANGIDEYLVSSPLLPRTALELAGLDPEGQESQWVVRIVLMLLAWPLADRAAERRMVESFVSS